jgi:hypothetical protein
VDAETRTRNWRWQDFYDATISPAGGGTGRFSENPILFFVTPDSQSLLMVVSGMVV